MKLQEKIGLMLAIFGMNLFDVAMRSWTVNGTVAVLAMITIGCLLFYSDS